MTGDSITVQGFFRLGIGGTIGEKHDRSGTTFTGNPLTISKSERGISTVFLSGVSARVTREEIAVTRANGEVVTLKRSDQPPRKFVASAGLAAGRVLKDTYDACAYRLADVRVGDEVSVEGQKVDGVWECLSICIDRRPGGRVPPSTKAGQTPPHPWHEWMNAYQDWEEKGIPMPDRFAPPWMKAPARVVPKVPDTIPPAK